ncbi:MAG: YkgJ family cysteine cluster protein [Desulfovibrionales bacterium]
MSDSPVCARCAALGPTCCEIDPSRAGDCFPLSRKEITGIQKATGRDDFFVSVRNTAGFVAIVRSLFPDRKRRVSELFPAKGSHHRLALSDAGACIFLTKIGCSLSIPVRPLYCRIYPFWIRAGRVSVVRDRTCLAQKNACGPRDVMQALGTGPKEIIDIHHQLTRAWDLE